MTSGDVLYHGNKTVSLPTQTPPPAYRPPYNKTSLPPYRLHLGSTQSPPGSAHSVQSGQSSYTSDIRYVFDYESSSGSIDSRTHQSQDNHQQIQPQRNQYDLYTPHSTVRRENHKPRRLPIIRGAPTVLPRPCTPSPPPPSGVVPVLSIYKAGPTKPPCYNEAVARRRTWSPLTFTKVMGNSTEASLSRARAFRSNDQLDMISNDRSQHGNNMPDQWQENVYEDPDEVMSSSTVMSPPPNIAPISGKLSPKSTEELVRPIAFKPFSGAPLQSRYVPTPARYTQCTRLPHVTSRKHSHITGDAVSQPQFRTSMKLIGQHSQDDGYVSQDYHGGFNYNTSGSDLTSYMDTYPTSTGHVTCTGGSYVNQTPSPDGGVGELEAVLRTKDAEIHHLRGVMEKNETAIFQVFDEKRQNWEVKLAEQQHESFRKEQSMMLTIHHCQQERDHMLEEFNSMKSEIESLNAQLGQQVSDSELQLIHANNQIQQATWEASQKTAELKDVRQCLSDTESRVFKMKKCLCDAETSLEIRDREVQRLREQLDLSMSECGGLRSEVDRLQRQAFHNKRSMVSNSQQTDTLPSTETYHVDETTDTGTETDVSSVNATAEVMEMHDQVDDIRAELIRYKHAFTEEQTRWLEEKDKVIRYQKHLQLNYEQMRKKNIRLETDINHLMVELETIDSPSMSTASSISSRCSTTSNMCKVPPLNSTRPPLETTTTPLASSTLKRDLLKVAKTPSTSSNISHGPIKVIHSLLSPNAVVHPLHLTPTCNGSKVIDTMVTKALPATTC